MGDQLTHTPTDVQMVAQFDQAVEQRWENPGEIPLALKIVRIAHAGQVRDGGNSFFAEHLVGSALILLNEVDPPIMDPDIISAVLLHDNLEETDYFMLRPDLSDPSADPTSSRESIPGPLTNRRYRTQAYTNIASELNPRIARMVLDVTKPFVDGVEIETHDQLDPAYLKTLRGADADSVVVKIADRLNNLRTLGNLSMERQYKIAGETLRDYLPIFETALEKYPQLRPLIDEIKEIASRYILND